MSLIRVGSRSGSGLAQETRPERLSPHGWPSWGMHETEAPGSPWLWINSGGAPRPVGEAISLLGLGVVARREGARVAFPATQAAEFGPRRIPYGFVDRSAGSARGLIVLSSGGDNSLPAYGMPPVVEVALAVEFEQSIGFRSLDLGRLADAWGDGWPLVEERPTLPSMESDDGDVLDSFLNALAGTAEPPDRLWMQNREGDQVVQLQHNRLVVNWRKGDAGDEYPRYGTVQKQLQDAWQRLLSTCKRLDLDVPVPSLCELQYVNHMDSVYGWNSSIDTAVLTVPWSGLGESEFFDADHLSQFSVHCHFPDDREGWLTIDCWTSHSSPSDLDGDSPLMVLKLTARGEAEPKDFKGALDFFDVAHRWIVEGFTHITTPEAHKIWKRLSH